MRTAARTAECEAAATDGSGDDASEKTKGVATKDESDDTGETEEVDTDDDEVEDGEDKTKEACDAHST